MTTQGIDFSGIANNPTSITRLDEFQQNDLRNAFQSYCENYGREYKRDSYEDFTFETRDQNLNQVVENVYKQPIPPFSSMTALPTVDYINVGAKMFTHTITKWTGRANKFTEGTTNISSVDLSEQSTPQGVLWYSISYGTNIKTQAHEAYEGRMKTELAGSAAKNTLFSTVNDLLFYGDETDNRVPVPGLLNHKLIKTETLAKPLTAESTKPKDLLSAMESSFNLYLNNKKLVQYPDTLLVPLSLNNKLNTRGSLDSQTESVFEVLRRRSNFLQLIPAHELDVPDKDGNLAMFLYINDPQYLAAVVPEWFAQFPPIQQMGRSRILCISVAGGVQVTAPETILRICFPPA